MSATLTTTLTPEKKQLLQDLNLRESEYQKIVNHLGREPNFNELGMFSVLWSEHCCYKNSRHLLKKLPTTGKRIVQGPGENAGIVDVGDGIQVAFKIESHNHPTAVEPFQGAATGVGGILRDIFTMNARPIANLNALRFGPLGSKTVGDPQTTPELNTAETRRNRYLFSHAVAGIANYGNCVGVPTVAGDVFFDESYSENPLVNAMSVGILYDNEIMAAGAKGVGNPVLYVGSATGKDGMGGAAFASKELNEQSNEDRPAVQVGDPFSEKLLIESCLEAFKTGCVVSAQDMGAAGLTCSGAEMSAKGNLGMEIDLDKVPAREPDMLPHEYLLSESQERMLMVLEKGREQPVLDVFAKWRVPAVIVGTVIAEEQVRFFHKGQRVVDVPAKLLTDLAPSYPRGDNPEEPEEAKARRSRKPEEAFGDITEDEIASWLEKLLTSHNIAQAGGVFHQYDRHVRNNTLLTSDHAASGVFRLRAKDGSDSGKTLAVTVDCNPRYVYLEPYTGAMSAVAEAARNLVCVGSQPLAVTDNLNFGNPEKADIYYQLYFSVIGIRDACLAFDTPVTGGNVSLYNEHSGRAILPAPVIGMIGLSEKELSEKEPAAGNRLMTPWLKTPGDKVAVLGRFQPALGGSEYQKLRTGEAYGQPPTISLNEEKKAQQLILQLIEKQQVKSVQDVSTGGVLVTLAETLFVAPEPVGFSGDLSVLTENRRLDTALFGETNGSYLVSYDPAQEAALIKLCDEAGMNLSPLGFVTEEPVLILNQTKLSLEPLNHRWRTALEL